jgi:hypothetical protein
MLGHFVYIPNYVFAERQNIQRYVCTLNGNTISLTACIAKL